MIAFLPGCDIYVVYPWATYFHIVLECSQLFRDDPHRLLRRYDSLRRIPHHLALRVVHEKLVIQRSQKFFALLFRLSVCGLQASHVFIALVYDLTPAVVGGELRKQFYFTNIQLLVLVILTTTRITSDGV